MVDRLQYFKPRRLFCGLRITPLKNIPRNESSSASDILTYIMTKKVFYGFYGTFMGSVFSVFLQKITK